VPTLLVFRAYPRLIELDPLNTFIKERATIIKKAIKALRKLQATRKVNNALST
jgi:hypothetical protein